MSFLKVKWYSRGNYYVDTINTYRMIKSNDIRFINTDLVLSVSKMKKTEIYSDETKTMAYTFIDGFYEVKMVGEDFPLVFLDEEDAKKLFSILKISF